MDNREAILARIFTVLTAIPPLMGYTTHTVVRNRGELPEGKRPAIVLLDGVEQIKTSYENRGRMFMTPAVMTLMPQIFVILKLRNTVANDGVGEELSAFRKAVVSALASDAVLVKLCGPNGQVSLRRVETDMQTGSTLEGQLRLDFAFDYVLDPNSI